MERVQRILPTFNDLIKDDKFFKNINQIFVLNFSSGVASGEVSSFLPYFALRIEGQFSENVSRILVKSSTFLNVQSLSTTLEHNCFGSNMLS
jgi:hypothetical protein